MRGLDITLTAAETAAETAADLDAGVAVKTWTWGGQVAPGRSGCPGGRHCGPNWSTACLGLPGTPMTVTHTDGFPVQPVRTDSVVPGMGERADAVVLLGGTSVPPAAAPYGKDGHARLDLRVNRKPVSADVTAFAAALQRQTPLDTATPAPTAAVTLPSRRPDRMLDARLSGPVQNYGRLINGTAYDPLAAGLSVTAGQRVRIRFVNDSMMVHPMHLHGHTIEVRGPDVPRARKDTVLVAPHKTVEPDFQADNPGKWIVHCHNEYHLESGMATYFDYGG